MEKVIFFIDKQKFIVSDKNLSVRHLLEDLAEEDSNETTLATKKEGEIIKFSDLCEVLVIENGKKFFVLHNTPTTVSYFGHERMIKDLSALGFEVELVTGADGNRYSIVKDFRIELGQFEGKVIDLGLLATKDFPRSVASAIHVKAAPQLFETTDTVPNVRNILASGLGGEWRYWSRNFNWSGGKSARRLISQINAIFEGA